MATAAEDLLEALGRLDAELSTANDEGLTDGVATLARVRVSCDALWLRVVGEVERRGLHRRHGVRDAASWLAGVAGERKGAARKDVELAGLLAEAPVIADAVAAGLVSKAKATELVRGRDLPDGVQENLVGSAACLPVEQLAVEVERARLTHGVAARPVAQQLTVTRRGDAREGRRHPGSRRR